MVEDHLAQEVTLDVEAIQILQANPILVEVTRVQEILTLEEEGIQVPEADQEVQALAEDEVETHLLQTALTPANQEVIQETVLLKEDLHL